jgi:hypothetical protein
MVLSVPGIGMFVSLVLRAFETGESGHHLLQPLWYFFLLVAIVLTYRELFRTLFGRMSQNRRPFAWLYCGVLNALWLSSLWPIGPVSSSFLIALIATASAIALSASAIALTIEYRALSRASRTKQTR